MPFVPTLRPAVPAEGRAVAAAAPLRRDPGQPGAAEQSVHVPAHQPRQGNRRAEAHAQDISWRREPEAQAQDISQRRELQGGS